MPELDEKTVDSSNSTDVEDQTTTSVDDTQQVDDDADGNASDDDSTDVKKTNTDDSEGDKSRGERRHDSYIDKLSEEIRTANSQASRYTEEIFTPDKSYQPLEYKDGDYDPKQLEADRKKVADNARADGVQTGLQQGTTQVVKELWADRLDIDSERVTTKWDALNPDKPDSFRPKLEAHLVQRYVQFVGVERQPNGQITIQKPNIRFRDFVDAEMKNMEEYADSRNATSSKNLVKQAASAGVRPNGQSRTTKTSSFDPNDPVGSVARMSSKEYFEGGGKEASDAYLAKQLGNK